MSTAEYEGLPLALLEAQAYGVVPIAFDSYASLRDVVTNGVDGIVIDEFGDTETFSHQLVLLMKDEKKIKELSENCLKTSSRFSSEVVGEKWLKILKDL